MGTLTTNYSLRKPSGTDSVDVVRDVDNLADDIDAALKAALAPYPKGIIARGNRTTNSTATGSESPVERIDNVSVTNGRIYKLRTSPLVMNSGTINNLLAATFRFNTAGVATTSSSQLPSLVESSFTAGGNQRTCSYSALYIPGGNFTVSFLLGVQLLGTVSASINANGVNNIDFWIEDAGLDPGDTGVDL